MTPITLAAIYNLSGGQSALDFPSWQGAQLAVELLNERPEFFVDLQLSLAAHRTSIMVCQQPSLAISCTSLCASLIAWYSWTAKSSRPGI